MDKNQQIKYILDNIVDTVNLQKKKEKHNTWDRNKFNNIILISCPLHTREAARVFFSLFFCVAKKTARFLAWKFMTGLVRKLNDRPNQFPITNYTGP